ncbi:MAG: IPT/TIG domain-containing protein, partial [Acidobacteria bacterium]|nr:IPT/TIG domain-containing protein [Acidobacteriota bacterium]
MVRTRLASLFRRGLLAFIVLLLTHATAAAAGSVSLYWDANSEPDLAGYVLVYGTAPGVYTQSVSLPASATTHEMTSLADGLYYFAVRAFSTGGVQSTYSNEVTVSMPFVASSTPAISSVSPATGATTGGTTVIVTGSGFVTGAVVRFGTTAGTVLTLTSNAITVRTPAGSAGAVAVSVTNPNGVSVSRPSVFTYGTAPTVSSVAPAVGVPSGGTSVTIRGTNFRAGMIVRFDGLPAVVSSVTTTTLVARTPAHAAGTVTVTVLNSDGQGVQLPAAFTYRAVAPTLTAVSPTSGPAAGGTDVTLYGTNFQAGAKVAVGTLQATVVSTTATRMVVRMPAHAAGLVGVTVANPDALLASKANAYSYQGQPPTITVVEPNHGTPTGGNSVTVRGGPFGVGTSVTIGGLAAAVLSQSAEALVVRAPAR